MIRKIVTTDGKDVYIQGHDGNFDHRMHIAQKVPKINLNEVTEKNCSAENTGRAQETTTSGRKKLKNKNGGTTKLGSHRSKDNFEFLPTKTFDMPKEMCRYDREEVQWGKRRPVIHVNKRPDREPFYTGPDKEAFTQQQIAKRQQERAVMTNNSTERLIIFSRQP